MLLAAPAGCVIGFVPHGRIDVALPAALSLGAAYGLVVGVATVAGQRVWVRRRAASGHRDRPT